ncbi:MAG: ABC transporter substrate-binding protein [Acidobacteria bacterium]|jgi:peptide/nickel transport system substrate-binding protein|nr:ABC transporter substrate-binding protein [Acidobacteriota bacterium]
MRARWIIGFTALAVVVLAGGLTACHHQTAKSITLRLGYEHDLVTFDPYAHDDSVTRSVLSALYEPLVSLSPELEVEPCLAERWTTPSERTWRFKIRRGVLFHDGRQLTVEDVLASLRRAIASPESVVATYLTTVEKVHRDTGDFVEITTKAPFPLLLSRLAFVPIVPADFNPARPIGTGPYRLVSSPEKRPLRLERWTSYWGKVPAADIVEIFGVTGRQALVRVLDGGQIDVMATVTSEFLQQWTVRPPWRIERIPSLTTTVLGMNVLRWPFTDPRVRKAIDISIDRRELVRTAFPAGEATPAASLIPVEVFGFSPTSVVSPAEPARARELLREAGVPEGTSIVLEHAGVPAGTLTYLNKALGEVGFQVSDRRYPWEEYYPRFMGGESGLFLFGWNFPFADASDMLDSVIHSRNPEKHLGLQNGSGYSNALVDRWIEAAVQEPRSAQRLEMLRQALRREAEDRPYLPLYHASRIVLARAPFTVVKRSGSWILPQEVLVENRED